MKVSVTHRRLTVFNRDLPVTECKKTIDADSKRAVRRWSMVTCEECLAKRPVYKKEQKEEEASA